MSFVPQLALALVHHPILDRTKKVVATNITNFDIHDIARAATVYGVDKYFIVHPMNEQLMFVERILDHWRVGIGFKFNPFRKTALNDVTTAPSLEAALQAWGRKDAIVVGTHARAVEGTAPISIPRLRELMHGEKKSVFLVFGTGFGMTDELMQGFDYILEPIRGAPPQDYRHLSVRSAVSIYLDRLMGPW